MRVLVTGGAGFIGASTALGLSARHRDWEIVAFDNLRRRGSELNLARLREAGIDYEPLRRQFPVLYQIHFSSERKRMTTVIRAGERMVVLVKGASEWLLEQSTRYQAADGTVRDWTPESRRVVQEQLRDTAGRAMRTLAFGYAILAPDTPADYDGLHARRQDLENSLVYVGFVAIRDPLREDVKTTFRAQAEIAVYYRGEDVEQIFRASVGRRFL